MCGRDWSSDVCSSDLMTRRVDLNADLGESFGPWRLGDDAALLDIVTSADRKSVV